MNRRHSRSLSACVWRPLPSAWPPSPPLPPFSSSAPRPASSSPASVSQFLYHANKKSRGNSYIKGRIFLPMILIAISVLFLHKFQALPPPSKSQQIGDETERETHPSSSFFFRSASSRSACIFNCERKWSSWSLFFLSSSAALTLAAAAFLSFSCLALSLASSACCFLASSCFRAFSSCSARFCSSCSAGTLKDHWARTSQHKRHFQS